MSGVRLIDGTFIELRSLDQRLTYGGLIEGVPTAELNRERLQRLGVSRDRTPRVVLPPTERVQQRPGRQPASFLPSKECTAYFYGPHLEIGVVTELVVVFFQEAWALPFSPEVERQIAAVDWEAVSRPYRWD